MSDRVSKIGDLHQKCMKRDPSITRGECQIVTSYIEQLLNLARAEGAYEYRFNKCLNGKFNPGVEHCERYIKRSSTFSNLKLAQERFRFIESEFDDMLSSRNS